jgi:type I restriction enzyme R subunit
LLNLICTPWLGIASTSAASCRIELENALRRVVTELVSDHTELYKQYSENDGFRRWLTETVFGLTYA